MENLNKIFGGVNKIAGVIIALVVGIVFTFGGYKLYTAPKSNYIETNATIVDMQTDEEGYTEVYVDYTVDGVNYNHILWNSYNASMDIGDVITVTYDENDPSSLGSNGTFLSIILMIGGIATIGFAIYNLFKKQKDITDDFNKVDMSKVSQSEIDKIKNNKEEEHEYCFHFDKHLKQGYVLEDDDKNIVYEIKMTKLTFFKPFTFEFINHKTQKNETIKIGHTVTKSSSVGNDSFELSTINESYFTINGERNWDYLARNGYSIDTHIEGLKICVDVKHYGIDVAYIENAGTNRMTGKDSKIGDIPASGIYVVNCKDSDLDMIMIVCMCVDRSMFNH